MAFLDKMKDSISKGIDTVSAKGKELAEDTQAYLQVKSLQGQREKALLELGTVALGLCQKGALADEAAKKICDAIAALDAQIAAEQAKLHDQKPKA
jgi:hypothetical protein